jgi:hypothetical protein
LAWSFGAELAAYASATELNVANLNRCGGGKHGLAIPPHGKPLRRQLHVIEGAADRVARQAGRFGGLQVAKAESVPGTDVNQFFDRVM